MEEEQPKSELDMLYERKAFLVQMKADYLAAGLKVGGINEVIKSVDERILIETNKIN